MEAVAKLRNIRKSPRKMRLIADMIRGRKVGQALDVLKFERAAGAPLVEKLLFSAIANWEQKYPENDDSVAELYIKEIFVDGGRMLKRIQPAPQGRAHRIRKRSCHVTLKLDLPESELEEIMQEIQSNVDEVQEVTETESDANNTNTSEE